MSGFKGGSIEEVLIREMVPVALLNWWNDLSAFVRKMILEFTLNMIGLM